MKIRAIDEQAGKFLIENKLWFSDLNDCTITADVRAEGETLRTVQFKVEDLAANSSREITIAIPELDQREVFINFTVRKDSRTLYSAANHEIAVYQYQLKESTANQARFVNHNTTPLMVEENRLNTVITGHNFALTFSKINGKLAPGWSTAKSLSSQS